jgi:excisionase family DNA binding protein
VPTTSQTRRWIRTGEVARILGVPVRTVRLWATKGILPSVQPASHRLYSAAVIEEFARQLDKEGGFRG